MAPDMTQRWTIPDEIIATRVLLRPCCRDDLSRFVAFMTDPIATRFLLFSKNLKTDAGARRFFEFLLDSYETESPIFVLAITDVKTNRYLGSCSLTSMDEPGTAECYYALLPECWGLGFATEAARVLLRHAFTELKLKRVVAFVSAENPASTRVAKKLGMQFDGEVHRPGEAVPEQQYSVGRLHFLAVENTARPSAETKRKGTTDFTDGHG